MCGIVGTFGFESRTTLTAMQRSIRHRGHDENNIKTWHSICGLGINRLSIMDVSAGHQPASNASGDVHVICNGEIYNHNALRQELCGRKIFASGSDVEVIAHLYEDYGTASVAMLDGMFAFVLYDARKKTFMAARDRYGIKPLYYLYDANRWYFASEAKAFLNIGVKVENVRLLPPGHYLTETGIHRYYNLQDHRRRTVADPELLYAILDAAVQRHLMADSCIKIGTFLSGGIDSSIITAIAAQYRPDLTAFSVGMPGSVDVANAATLCAYLGIEHVVLPFNLEQIWSLVPQAVYQLENYNPLIVVEGLMQMMLSKAAQEHGVKVMLSGEGADEIFAGYSMYRDKTPDTTREMLQSSMAHINNTECLRLDRATMAYSIEARVPFLDPMVVEYAINLPVNAMLRQEKNETIEKWILRKASEHVLPPEFVWRPKLVFYEGSGIGALLDQINDKVSDQELRLAQQDQPHAHIGGKASLFFYRIFKSHFGDMGGNRVFELFGDYPVFRSSMDGLSRSGAMDEEKPAASMGTAVHAHSRCTVSG